MQYFLYGDKEIKYLKEKDPILGKAIDDIGMIKREVNPDPFESLVSSVISQQISTKAAITVKARLVDLVGEITPEKMLDLELDTIKSCGMSMRKASYIKAVIDAATSKEIDFENLNNLSDEEVIKELTALKGVGIWTAEMILIFSLQRDNVLSYGDLAIRRGMMRLYKLDSLDKAIFNKYKEKYSPYGSVASLYLWELSRLDR